MIGFVIGLQAGLITAGIFHLIYVRLRTRPRLQLSLFLCTLFAALLPSVVLGIADMRASGAQYYWQADLSGCVSYIGGWMIMSFLCFGFAHMRRLDK